MFNTILVPLDGSGLSERALLPASRLGRATGATLVLVRAAWSPGASELDPMAAQIRAVREARVYLETMRDRLSREGLKVEIRVPFALAASGVLREIEMCHADLVVMASHRRETPDHQLYGSVAQAVLARSLAPVIVMRVDEFSQPGGKPTAKPQVLVPLDGSHFSEAVLPVVAEFARALNWSLVLLRVLPSLSQPLLSPDELLDEEGEAVSYLVGLAAPLRQTGLRVHTQVKRGIPAPSILLESHDPDTCMIAMTTHGQTGLHEMLFGSVAQTVLRQSEIPILLIRATDAPRAMGERYEHTRLAEATPSH
jgi:nucleotide-binding universal stress UspA family protein